MAERAVVWILRIGGVVILAIALTHVIFGPTSIPGSVPVNATMDSEDRFYATIFGGYGFAALWAAQAVAERRKIIVFLMYLLIAGGFARLISLAIVGLPHPLFLFLTAVEFILPAIMLLLLRNVQPSN